MSNRFYWKKDEDSTTCICRGFKECHKLLKDKGGYAWVETHGRRGLEKIEKIEIPNQHGGN